MQKRNKWKKNINLKFVKKKQRVLIEEIISTQNK